MERKNKWYKTRFIDQKFNGDITTWRGGGRCVCIQWTQIVHVCVCVVVVVGANNRMCSTRHTNLTQLHSKIQLFVAAVVVVRVCDWLMCRIKFNLRMKIANARFEIGQFFMKFLVNQNRQKYSTWRFGGKVKLSTVQCYPSRNCKFGEKKRESQIWASRKCDGSSNKSVIIMKWDQINYGYGLRKRMKSIEQKYKHQQKRARTHTQAANT